MDKCILAIELEKDGEYPSSHIQEFQNKYYHLMLGCEKLGLDKEESYGIKKILIEIDSVKRKLTRKIVAVENNFIPLEKIKDIRSQMKFIKLSSSPIIRQIILKNIIKILND